MSSLKREPMEFDDDDDDDMMDDDDDDAMDATMSVSMANEVSDLSMKAEPESPIESDPRPPIRAAPQGQPSSRSSRRKPAAPQWVNPEWQEVVDVSGVGIRGVGSAEEKREVIINGVCVMQTDAPFGSAGAGVSSGVSPRTAIEDEEEEEDEDEDGVERRTVGNEDEMGSRPEDEEAMEEGAESSVTGRGDEQATEGVGEEEDGRSAESPRLMPCRSDEGDVEAKEDGESEGLVKEERCEGGDERDSGAAQMIDSRDEDEAAMDESLEKLQKRMKREEEEEEEDWEF